MLKKSSKHKSVVIVGAGIYGGMCTAARLLKDGYRVKIFEKEPIVGGRANRIIQDGYKFDIGPTLLNDWQIRFMKLSIIVGKNFDDYIDLIQLEL
jgi:phytoene desaturase